MDLYHVLNRGVDKRVIFDDDQDRSRFVHDLYEFNDSKRAKNSARRINEHMSDVGRRSTESRDMLVDLHGWCLMGNHYHLLMSERIEGGLSEFLQKLNGGYAKYYNEKNGRVGALFQGKTKRVLIESDAHFLHILHYIHLNPLDFSAGAKRWREQRIQSADKALRHLEQYRWSSFSDYCNVKNFPSIITTSLFSEIFKDYRRSMRSYVRDIQSSSIRELLLE